MVGAMRHFVEVIIENKRSARDPEGETVYLQLISRRGFRSVVSVRSGKYFRFEVEAEDADAAVDMVKEICSKLRIYNPVIHDIEVRPYPQHGGHKVSRH